MNTPRQITEAIAHAEQELASLKETAAMLDTLRYRQQTISAGIHLGSHTREQLQSVQDQIVAACEARDAIPLKQSAIHSLQRELEAETGRQRRLSIQERIALFDRLKADYRQQSQSLLETFRNLHRLHAEVLGASGQHLLHPGDYLLHLPECAGRYDSTAFRTGQIVAAASAPTPRQFA